MILALFNVLLGVDSFEDRETLRNELILSGVLPVLEVSIADPDFVYPALALRSVSLQNLRNKAVEGLGENGLAHENTEVAPEAENDRALYLRLVQERIGMQTWCFDVEPAFTE